MNAIALKAVGEKYRIKFIRDRKVSWEEIWALKDIDLNVKQGEVLGIIGQNGAGKTTLLKLIAGMLLPDTGTSEVSGRVATLMELGAGFNPEFTGRENVMLNARAYGIDDSQLKEKFGAIIDFAGLGEFIDAPVKYYSQGMYVRLAFALAVFVDPDIFLIDDVLSVGDQDAQIKCIEKIFDFKRRGRTMIIVSHDMHMINKLCDRVIVMDKGKIVRQGRADEMVSCYLETVGDKKGIAVLEQGLFRFTFNNGSMAISFSNKPLFTPRGFYTSFFTPSLNRWCSSQELSWKVIEHSARRIVAEGNFGVNQVSQKWEICFQDKQVSFNIVSEGGNIKDIHTDMIFVSKYRRWHTSKESKDFPDFLQGDDWNNLGSIDHPYGVLGFSPDDKTDLPYVALRQASHDARIALLNTGLEQSGRVLQAFSFDGSVLDLSLWFYTDQRDFLDYMRSEHASSNTVTEDAMAIESGQLSLKVDDRLKKIALFISGRDVSGDLGFHHAFHTSKGVFTSFDAKWKALKKSDKELLLVLEYPLFALAFTWRFLADKKDVLSIGCSMDVGQPVDMFAQHVHMVLKDIFKGWMTESEEGDFASIQAFDGVSPVRMKNNRASQIALNLDMGLSPSNLLFRMLSKPENRLLTICKTRGSSGTESIYLNSALTIPKKNQLFTKGRYDYFHGELALGLKLMPSASSVSQTVQLQSGRAKFTLDSGRIFASYDKTELTAGLGAYTCVRSGGIWYDSSQAFWEVEEKSDKRIVACGFWPQLPVSQRWFLELHGPGSILWHVESEILEDTVFEIEQVNLMLGDFFKTWSVSSGQTGLFGDYFTQEYDILPYRFWSAHTDFMETKGDSVPKVVFRQTSAQPQLLRGVIENTDSLYKARLLQYQKSNQGKQTPRNYSLFQGVIEIGY